MSPSFLHRQDSSPRLILRHVPYPHESHKIRRLALGSGILSESKITLLKNWVQRCRQQVGEREREREVMPVVSRHICTERVWEGDSMLNVNGRGALRSHSLNRNAWNTCWPDAVWIRPACSNSKQRVRPRLWGTPVVFEMFESWYPCVMSSPLICGTAGRGCGERSEGLGNRVEGMLEESERGLWGVEGNRPCCQTRSLCFLKSCSLLIPMIYTLL